MAPKIGVLGSIDSMVNSLSPVTSLATPIATALDTFFFIPYAISAFMTPTTITAPVDVVTDPFPFTVSGKLFATIRDTILTTVAIPAFSKDTFSPSAPKINAFVIAVSMSPV